MNDASVLIVEDEAVTALDLQELLEQAGYAITAVAATADDALNTIDARPPDLALVDIHLADGSNGISLAEEIIRRIHCPIIFLTAHSDQAIVARAEALMPAAYLLKPFNEREVTIAIRLALAKHVSDRALRASERRYATTLDAITEGILVVDQQEQIVLMNPAATVLINQRAEAAIGRPLPAVALLAPGQADPGASSAADEEPWWRLIRTDGTVREVTFARAPLVDDRGKPTGAVLVFRDITVQRRAFAERRTLEQHLQAIQRVESLGLIAGGIAHDFNNILLIVNGYTELALAEANPTSTLHKLLSEAMHGLERAGELTRQLLLYAGRGPIALQVVDLNALLHDMRALMHAALGPLIEVILDSARPLPPIAGDPTQLRQVILNLLTNAAEAMAARGGRVTVTTRIAAEAVGADLPLPGPYIELCVIDEGCGMDAATLARIFDPFYTTKRSGRGLGLATVQGIIHRHHGAISAISTPGSGTTMQILLPVYRNTPDASSQPAPSVRQTTPQTVPAPNATASTLLIIDDEPEVRAIAARLLRRLGYESVLAADGTTGIARLQEDPGAFSGALIDLNMPGEHGTAVAAAIHAFQPDFPIILMSGYLEDAAMGTTPPTAKVSFLQKPFSLADLTAVLTAAGLYRTET